MLQPQELVVAKLLPTIRARLARELLRTYKMKQVGVARSMGITQAAVSHYNTQSRGMDQEMLRLFPEISPFVDELAEALNRGVCATRKEPASSEGTRPRRISLLGPRSRRALPATRIRRDRGFCLRTNRRSRAAGIRSPRRAPSRGIRPRLSRGRTSRRP